MADSIGDVSLFVAVADAAGITAAAASLGSSPAVVSRKLAAIEARLGVRLAERDARRFALTEEGILYLARGREILKASRDMDAEVSARGRGARGRLRIGAPVELGRDRVADIVGAFLREHPGIEAHLDLSDAGFEIGADGLDVALRFGLPDNPSVAARRVATTPRILCAAPGYLAEKGTPSRPADLAGHECLRLTRRGGRTEPWLLREGGEVCAVQVAGRMASSNDAVIHGWALAGFGIAREARWDVAEDIRRGRLVEVLADHWCDVVEVYAVFQPGSSASHRVQLFVSYLASHLSAMAQVPR